MYYVPFPRIANREKYRKDYLLFNKRTAKSLSKYLHGASFEEIMTFGVRMQSYPPMKMKAALRFD